MGWSVLTQNFRLLAWQAVRRLSITFAVRGAVCSGYGILFLVVEELTSHCNTIRARAYLTLFSALLFIFFLFLFTNCWQELTRIALVYANVSNAVSWTIYWCRLGSCGFWSCMRLDLLVGSARGCPGSTYISPV